MFNLEQIEEAIQAKWADVEAADPENRQRLENEFKVRAHAQQLAARIEGKNEQEKNQPSTSLFLDGWLHQFINRPIREIHLIQNPMPSMDREPAVMFLYAESGMYDGRELDNTIAVTYGMRYMTQQVNFQVTNALEELHPELKLFHHLVKPMRLDIYQSQFHNIPIYIPENKLDIKTLLSALSYHIKQVTSNHDGFLPTYNSMRHADEVIGEEWAHLYQLATPQWYNKILELRNS